MKNITLLSLLLFFILNGCAPFAPSLDSLRQPAGLPERFSISSKGVVADQQWWKEFKSEELNRLIDEAVTENFSVREAWARLSQIRYTAIKSGADRFPGVDLSGGGVYTLTKTGDNPSFSSDEYSFGISVGYEIDLWGRVQAQKKSAELLYEASKEDLKTALMTVTGQIAENWINLISIRKQQARFTVQLDLQKQLLHLIKIRFPLARSTALDIYQQQQSIEKVRAALIPLKSREKIIKRRLALLVGKALVDDQEILENEFPAIPEVPAIGLPAGLLASRPDIQAAVLRLQSSEWDIAKARADRLPALKLTAAHTYSSEEFSSLFDNWLRNLAANLAGPLFDGRERQAEVKRRLEISEERLAAYGKTVFDAIKEVEDALTEEKQYAKTITSLKKQLTLSNNTIREAKRRYLNGNSDFVNVLREELNILQVRQDLIIAEADMIIARIALHKALGGRWADNL